MNFMTWPLTAVMICSASVSSAETIALVGGTVHPVSRPDIVDGTVLFRDGKIVAIGTDVKVPADAKIVKIAGKHVYPSLFPPVSVLGLVEISSVRGTVDVAEAGETNPQARGESGMNFDSELLPVARSAGILLAGVGPTGGLISGTISAMKLDGWTREDASLSSVAAILVRWPSLRIDRSSKALFSARLQEKRRDEAVARLKNTFLEARAYAKANGAGGKSGIPSQDFDAKLEALIPAIERKVPVIVEANALLQIRSALSWAKDENLRLAILGGADAVRVADELAKSGTVVILHLPLTVPSRVDEPYDANFAAPGALVGAGVRVAFTEGTSPSSAPRARDLVQQAGMAVGFGMPRQKALEALTLEPARILGVDDRVGSLEPGKDATLFVSDGDIMDVRSIVESAFLEGRLLDLTDKHKRLYQRYRNRPRAKPKT